MAFEFSSNMRATTEAFLKAFEGQWAPGATMDLRAPECKHTMLPSSMGIPTKNNDEWAARFKRLSGLMSEAKMTMHEYIAVPDERRVVCTSSMSATTPVGPFSNEYVWIFTFDESGRKVTNITEFFDSKAATEIVSKLTEGGYLEAH